MADVQKDIVLRVKAESEQATGQFKNLKQELRSIEGELNRMAESGDTGSKAFQELQKRAGQVKDQIGDTKSAIKALSSDTFKLDAFAQGAQAIAGGFASAQGAMALFGSENQQVEEAIKKTQGAMALLQGVTSITNILQKESALRLAITTTAQGAYTAVVGASTGAMKLFRLALASTGIGALVVGLGLLISNFDDVKKVVNNLLKPFDGIIAKVRDFLSTISFGLIDDASTAKTKANAETSLEAINKLAKANESIEKQMQRNIDIAKAKGNNDKEVYKLEKQLLDFRLKNNYAEQEAIKNKIKLGTASEEEKKRLQELVQTARDSVKDREILDINYQKGVEKRNEDKKQKKKENDKKEADEEKKKYDDSIKANEAYYAHLIAEAQLNDQETETLEIQKLEKQLEIDSKYGKDTIALADQIALKKKEIKDKEAEEIKTLEDKERQLSLDADRRYLDARLESGRFNLEQEKAMLEEAYLNGVISETEYNDKITAIEKEASDKRKEIKEKEAQAQSQMIDLIGSGLGELSKLVGENTKAGKAFAIASTIIDTYQAAQKAYLGQLALTTPDAPIRANIAAAIAIAQGLARVKAISGIKIGKNATNSPSSPNGGGGSIPSPSTQATQTSGLDSTQLQLDAQGNLMQQRTMRTYVLETDISAKQQRSKRLQQTATLGK